MSQCPNCLSMLTIMDGRRPGSYGKGEPKFDDYAFHCLNCGHQFIIRRVRK